MEKIFKKFFAEKQKGFTLIEVLVSVFIVITLTTLVLANFEWGGYNFALERSLRALSQQIRVIQEMALSSKEVEGTVPRGGYGIYFNQDFPDKYILFADLPHPVTGVVNWQYGEEGGQDKIIAEHYFERDVSISGLYSSSSGSALAFLNIVFLPPDPKVYINGFAEADDFLGKIFLTAINKATGSVSINRVGLVEVEK